MTTISPDSPTPVPELLTDLSPYIYGTGRLGDTTIPFDARVRVARAAMDAGVWFHTSHTYGETLAVLRAAFDQARHQTPKLIVKIGWQQLAEVRDTIRQNTEPLAVDHLDIGQLCLSGDLGDDFARGGESVAEFRRIKDEGLVRRFVLEVFPWTSWIALDALRAGHAQGLIDGYILYFNPLQRFASNALWAELQARRVPLIAMRTVGGGDVRTLRDTPRTGHSAYIQQRAAEVAPIFERSGLASWTEFCVRFALSFAQVRGTVGATARTENLEAFLRAAKGWEPLPQDLINPILARQQRWSDEVDLKAEPWTM